jgi:hypothetical protein
LIFILFSLVVILGIGVLSALVLALGTLLTQVFAVSVFEATLIVVLVSLAVIWVLQRTLGPPEPEIGESDDEPSIYLTPLPPPWPRRPKKPRR